MANTDKGDRPENTTDNPESVAAWRARALNAEAALREIVQINDEDQGAFRKRGGTRRGLSIVTARDAIEKATGSRA